MTFRLSEQPEAVGVAAALIEAAIGIPSAHVEKDFWITETLRAAATQAETEGVTLVFKGGTSLSKAYGLIQRFSEDVDLIIVPPADSQKAADRCLKSITSAVGLALGVPGEVDESTTTRGRKRTTSFDYPKHQTSTGASTRRPSRARRTRRDTPG